MNIQVTDINGNIVLISREELNKVITKELDSIFGVPFSRIKELIKEDRLK